MVGSRQMKKHMLIPQDHIVKKEVRVRARTWYSPAEHTRVVRLLSEEMRVWFKENRLTRGKSYRLHIPWVHFTKAEDAILFRLRWH